MAGRILIAEPNQELAENLKTFFGSLKDFRLVGLYSSGVEAIGAAIVLRPDIFILDVALDDINAFEIAVSAQNLFQKAKIVLLCAEDLPEYRKAIAKSRAALFLNKAALHRELSRVLARATRGNRLALGERAPKMIARVQGQLRLQFDYLGMAAMMRHKAGFWRLVHLLMIILSAEIIAASYVRHGELQWLLVAACAALLDTLVIDFRSLWVASSTHSNKQHCMTGVKTIR